MLRVSFLVVTPNTCFTWIDQLACLWMLDSIVKIGAFSAGFGAGIDDRLPKPSRIFVSVGVPFQLLAIAFDLVGLPRVFSFGIQQYVIVADAKPLCVVLLRVFFLPYDVRDKVRSTKDLVAEHFKIMCLVVINRDP
ncbi:hypothetical protein D3C84_815010 [compost metagenome]